MAFVFGDRVKETSLTTGIGTMALGGAAVGFQSFAVGVGVGNECFYGIVNTADNSWEMGRGTVGPGALSRDTVISSSNSNLAVNLVAGQKVVYTTIPDQFYDSLLDAPAHAAINHTLAPFNLLDATAHQGVDHTAAPFNLLATANLGIEHALIDHKSAPFNLLDSAAHAVIDHKAAPFNLLDSAAHSSINHLAAPFNLLNEAQHDLLDHTGLPGVGGGGTPSKLVQQVYTPITAATQLTAFCPPDGSIPQIGEGHLVGSVSITPQAVNNILEFEFWGYGDMNGFNPIVCIHFHQSAAANAFASGFDHWNGAPGGAGGMWNLRAQIVGGLPLVNTTFQVVVGMGSGVAGLNGSSTPALLYGAPQSSFSVKEYLP